MTEKQHSAYGLGGRFERTLKEDVPSTYAVGSDEYWMEQALLVSMRSVGLSSPNPAVGCVLVRNQKKIAEGFTQAFRKEHSERMAFHSLPSDMDLRDVTAYVTLEPCSHHGHQPPCVDLFLERPVRKIVISVQDPDLRVNGQGIDRLKKAGIEVVTGVLENEARLWHFPFLRQQQKKSPVWIAKWAQTKHGDLAGAGGVSKWITGKDARAYTHWLRQKYDVIVIGAQTLLHDQPSLTVRDCALPRDRDPVAVVFDPKGITHSIQTVRPMIRIPCDPKDPNLFLSFKTAVEQLQIGRPIQSIMVEGGASLLNGLFAIDAFDAAHEFIGSKEFENRDPKYQIHFSKSTKWKSAARYSFGDDDLQEWIKEI